MSFPRYPKYKDSGVEWLGEVPEGWEVKKVSHLADLIAGFAFSSDQFEFDPEKGIPLVRGDNVTEGWLRWGEKGRYWPFHLEYEPRYMLQEDDILIQMDGSKVGKNWALVGKKDLPALLVQRVTRVRVKGALPRFVYSLFSNELFVRYVDKAKTDPAIPHITMKNIGDYWIPVPPKDEQSCISAFLKTETAKIDELVAEQERLMELLKEKRQAVISHAVTKGRNPSAPMKPSGIEWLGDVPAHWEVKPIKSLCKLFGRIGYRGYTTEDIVGEGEGAITLSPSNMANGAVSTVKCTYIKWQKYEESPEIKIQPQDVVMVKTGSTFGKVAYVEEVPHPATINPQLVLFKQISCLPKFLFHLLSSNFLQAMIEVNNSGSTIPTMSQEVIANFKSAIPPKVEQEKLVDFLEKEFSEIDNLKAEAQRAIDLLQERRTALISAAVTGQIDVRGAATQR